MNLLVFVFAGLALVPSSAHAQNHVTVDISYVGGTLGDMFDYPTDSTMRSGKKFDTNGVAIDAIVRLTDRVSAGYR